MSDANDLDFGQTIQGYAEGQKVFGRFTLRRILGRGGMGVVWLAWDEKLEEEGALKFMPEMVRLDAVALKDLIRETRRSRKLTHANIVRIHDFFEDTQTAAIAMEYVDGWTLSSLRLHQPGEVFTVETLDGWLRQLATALGYAHETGGLVHRDLKPSNLMVDARGQLKITDFGISSSITDSVSRMSMRAGTSGSPPYMSPQQLLGEPPQVTDDIYSLGATIYELLTGKPPFHRGNIPRQIESVVPPPMSERRTELGHEGPAIPPAWETAVAACLAKTPGERPQSLREVLQALDGAAAPSIPVVEIKAVAEKTPPPSRRLGLIAARGALLALLAGAGWYFGIHQPAEHARQTEIAKRESEEQAQAGRDTEERARKEQEAERLRAENEKADAERQAKARADEEAQKAVASAEAKKAEEQRQQELAAEAAKKSPASDYLRLTKFISQPFHLKFTGTPDGQTFAINPGDPGERTQFLELGEMIRGTTYKLVSYEKKAKTVNDIETDVSELTLEDMKNGRKIILVTNAESNGPSSVGEFVDLSDNSKLTVKKGDIFSLTSAPDHKYKLVNVSDQGAVVDDLATGKTLSIPLFTGLATEVAEIPNSVLAPTPLSNPASSVSAKKTGRILSINGAWQFVVLRLGEMNSLTPGTVMQVLRKGRIVGKIKVTSVEPGTPIAIADILDPDKWVPKVTDEVRTE